MALYALPSIDCFASKKEPRHSNHHSHHNTGDNDNDDNDNKHRHHKVKVCYTRNQIVNACDVKNGNINDVVFIGQLYALVKAHTDTFPPSSYCIPAVYDGPVIQSLVYRVIELSKTADCNVPVELLIQRADVRSCL